MKVCAYCGTEFKPRQWQPGQKYCNHSCHTSHRNKSQAVPCPVSVEELLELYVLQEKTLVQVAVVLKDVQPCANVHFVRRWLRDAGIDKRPKSAVSAKVWREQRPHPFDAEKGTKVCARCGIEKTVQSFCKSRQQCDGYHCYCRDCTREIRAREKLAFAENRVSPTDGYKICGDCGKRKPVEDFWPTRYSRDGLYAYCRDCSSQQKKNRIENMTHDERRHYQARQRHRNRWWRRLNYRKYLNIQRSYRKTETYKINHVVSESRRKSQKLGNGGRLTTEQWRQILRAYGCCAYCGATDLELTMDHVVPLSKGGPHSPDNVVPACRICNCRKSDKLIDPLIRIPLREIFTGVPK